eukprot:9456276-Prorocentrum_lima.AAC.1
MDGAGEVEAPTRDRTMHKGQSSQATSKATTADPGDGSADTWSHFNLILSLQPLQSQSSAVVRKP